VLLGKERTERRYEKQTRKGTEEKGNKNKMSTAQQECRILNTNFLVNVSLYKKK
jgi:hypothetical protein